VIGRRSFLAGTLGAAGLVALAACTDGDDGPDGGAGPADRPDGGTGVGTLGGPGAAGLVDEGVYQARVDEYLAFATEQLDPANATNIAAHLIRAGRDPDWSWDVDAVTVDSLRAVWDRIDRWEDTRDFQLLYLHWLLALGAGATPTTTLDPAVLAAIEERMIANRYRYDDPLPADRVDDQWFWSENHVIIGLVDEYLAGRRFPDATFAVTGLTGAAHAERAEPAILAWVDERARFGFFEWHSHVYLLKNITPLLTLAELADDPELVAAAVMALDLCLLDLAGHTHAGTYTASRGRTYKKDKMTARDEDTFGTARFLFADTDRPYPSRSDTGATYFCAAARYRPPQAIVDVAVAPSPGVTRERHGIFVDGAAPVTDAPEAPFGYDFADPANLTFWWSQGALGMWQVAEISLAEAERHRLFEAPIFAEVKLLAELNGYDPERVKAWEQANHAIVNFGHLREANTYCWRGDEVALASVVDHRFGQMRDQVHAWQATIDADALVFTTHPCAGLAETTDWDVDPDPGYWTGEASMPRSAQYERTAVHVYQPAWGPESDPLLWSAFRYRDYTHAYVPQDRFDEVVQAGNWTVARKGGAAIALWSWRAPTWRVYDPGRYATDGMTKPFDLVAEGGPDNVWIVEVADGLGGPGGDLDAWAAAVTGATVAVERDDAGFRVRWASPSAGEVGFGSTGPLTVGGVEVALGDFPRHESAFATVDRLATTYDVDTGGARLSLDFDRRTRRTT
jgi:hypothetical protein